MTVANVNTIITFSKLEKFPSLVWGKIPVHKKSKTIKINSINTHLSLDMLQSIIVLLLVLTIKKGSWIVEFKDGGPWFCCSFCWFLCTKFLNAICCKTKERKKGHWQQKSRQCFQEMKPHRSYLPILNTLNNFLSKSELRPDFLFALVKFTRSQI